MDDLTVTAVNTWGRKYQGVYWNLPAELYDTMKKYYEHLEGDDKPGSMEEWGIALLTQGLVFINLQMKLAQQKADASMLVQPAGSPLPMGTAEKLRALRGPTADKVVLG